MRVIRCEKADNPYVGAMCAPVVLEWDLSKPTPQAEGYSKDGYDLGPGVFCAAPPDMVAFWFNDEVRPQLRAAGWRFVELEVDDPVFVSECQVLIRRASAREIGEYLQ